VVAPWQREYPPGRMIPEEMRHITLAFLGQASVSKIKNLLPGLPRPNFVIGSTGIAKTLVFLPKGRSRVAAFTVDWLDAERQIDHYQQTLSEWLRNQGYILDKKPFFPHLSVARSPFDKELWQSQFSSLPFFIKAIHLYQSMGNLQYQSLWEHSLLSPFEEFEHTADIAFLIRGHSNQELHRHAQLALAFKFPPLVELLNSPLQNSLDEIIISLNELVATADIEFGCPFKAVSFHGTIKANEHDILQWEMIVDV